MQGKDEDAAKTASATARMQKDVAELTLWCQRLAVMVHNCSQPSTMVHDMQVLLNKQALRIDELELSVKDQFESLQTRLADLEDGMYVVTGSDGHTDSMHGNAGISPRAARARGFSSSDTSTLDDNAIKPSSNRVQTQRSNKSTAGALVKSSDVSLEMREMSNERSDEGEDMNVARSGSDATRERTGSDVGSDINVETLMRISDMEKLVQNITRKSMMEMSGAQEEVADGSHLFAMTTCEEFEYEMQPSIWDAAMFMVFDFPAEFPFGHWSDRISLLITYVLNLIMQLTLIASIYLGMLEDPFEDDMYEGIADYRAAQALILKDGISMADHLCERNVFSFEGEFYEDLYKWSRPAFSFPDTQIPGPCLTFLGITVWVCSIFSDYDSMSMQLRGILAMPYNIDCTILAAEDKGHRLIRVGGINTLTRLGFLFLIIVPRMFVNIALCYVGVRYIAITYTFSDIVLNCVALMFVLEMDEILYDVFLPKAIRKALTEFEPIQVVRISLFGGIELGDAVRWLLMTMVLIATYFRVLLPANEMIIKAVSSFCPDEIVTSGRLF